MLLAEILHSCADAGIAEAAVASIGGPFAARMRLEAARSEMSLGALTGSLVSGFAAEAGERDWRELTASMARADQPVLTGVQLMAERMLARRAHQPRPRALRDAPSPRPAAAPAAVCTL